MFSMRKRIFAGKSNLQSEPFCPYLTDEGGRLSLQRTLTSHNRAGATPHARAYQGDGKHRV